MTPQQLARRIHQSNNRLVMVITGGASGAIAVVLTVPGASRSVLDTDALKNFMGSGWQGSGSEKVVRYLAMAAFRRTLERRNACDSSNAADVLPEQEIIGISCSRELASDRSRKGTQAIHAAIQTSRSSHYMLLELQKGNRSCEMEEQLAAHMILNQIAQACDIQASVELDLLKTEAFSEQHTRADPAWRSLLLGDQTLIGATPAVRHGMEIPNAVFPGAFNPRHEGHTKMARLAELKLRTDVAFEISLANVDKPWLDYTELATRLDFFKTTEAVWVTRAATFEEKSCLFPRATFVVGADTIVRIADPCYYHGPEECERSIQRIVDYGCRFLVFGRQDQNRFQCLSDLDLPRLLRDICEEVSEQEFRQDICSTALRDTGEQENS